MKKNWKCKIGLHDWEQIARCTNDQIDKYAYKQVYGYQPWLSCDMNTFEQKVCLRCGKYVDNITPAKAKAVNKLVGKKIRKERADRILNDKKIV